MALAREEKIEIYNLRILGMTISDLSKKFGIEASSVKYLLRLINRHGFHIVRQKNRYYSPKFKRRAINRILFGKEPINAVSIDLGLQSMGTLHLWLSKFKQDGYAVIERKRGRPSMAKKDKNIPQKDISLEEKLKQLEKENLYLRAENDYLKKLDALMIAEEQKRKN